MSGKVYLVGAGPGDPELLTLKGRRALERADVVFYDHLAPEDLLDFAPSPARHVYVGKKRAIHAYAQDEITAMLIECAQAGETVVRLKGGDPYLFGRGGEEAEALADAGITFEVIPGVTSPVGIAAYCGIPLTHRDHTSVVSIVTGHDVSAIDWERFGHAETLVILMGLTNFADIAERIIAGGRAPATPAVAVRWATRPDQETVEGTLATLPRLVAERGLKPPATVIVGDVARARSKLNWFERLPLFGQRVVITRPRAQAADMAAKLRDLGAWPLLFPAISIEPASDYGALDRAIASLSDWDWLIFTSVNGVHSFLARLDGSPVDLRKLRARIAVIGPATKQAVEDAHLKVDVIGDEFVAESLALALRPFVKRGDRVLLVRAAAARQTLPDELWDLGASVEVAEAYQTVASHRLADRARELEASPPDWVTFTSSSTVDHFLAAVHSDALRHAKIASIGPVTSATLRNHGIEPAVEARVFTADGLIEAIREAVGKESVAF